MSSEHAQATRLRPRLSGSLALAARAAVALVGALLTTLVGPSTTRAQPGSTSGPIGAPLETLSGRWSAGPMTLRWNVGEWTNACGPRPTAETTPAETVTVEQRGSELTIHQSSGSYSTTHCYEPLPNLVRRTHSSGQRNWGNLCASAPGDNRQATIRTNLSASSDRIDFSETAQYEFVASGQRCTASSGRWRTYRLLQRAGSTTGADLPKSSESRSTPPSEARPQPSSVPGQSPSCDAPGPAIRLEIFPNSKLLRPGDQLEFKSVARDEAGCEVRKRPRFVVSDRNRGVSVAANGKLEIGADAPEGRTVIDAKLDSLSVPIQIEVVSRERYAALLKTDSDEARVSDKPTAPEVLPSQLRAGNTIAENTAERRKWLFLALASLVALGLATAGAWLLRRGRRGQPPSVELLEPNQKTEPEATHAEGAKPAEEAAAREPARQRRAGPRGRRDTRYYDGRERIPSGPDLRQVGHDPSPTVDQLSQPKRVAEGTPRARRVCPTCGTLYETEMKFCGKDGTALLPVN